MATNTEAFSSFCAGQRVATSGQGRTARWPYGYGTVTAVRRKSVIVRWDGSSFEDEMDPPEVRPLKDSDPGSGSVWAPPPRRPATGYSRTGQFVPVVIPRAAVFLIAILAGMVINHPLIYELWAGPVRLSALYPDTIAGQTQALKDLSTVGLLASLTVALVVYSLVSRGLPRMADWAKEVTSGE